MKHVIIRVAGAAEHSKGQHDEPLWWLVFKDMLPRGEESMSLGSRIVAVGCIQIGGLILKAG